MFPFEEEISTQVEKYNNKKALFELEFMDGDKLFVFGILEGSNLVINLKHDSKVLPVFNDLMSDFHIQILKPSPFISLVNLTRYRNGIEIASDQTGLNSFKILDPLEQYEDFPEEMVSNLKSEEGNTVIIIPEIIKEFPKNLFNNHVDRISKNGIILNTKTFNGFLTVNNKEIIINNVRAEHFPQWDLGYIPESDFIAIIRFRKGYTMEFRDKKTNVSIEMNIEGFNFYGQN